MKLLLVSDLHCDPPKLDWVATHASAFDAVAVAGDLLNIFSPVESAWQEDVILAWKSRIVASGTPLIWCSGNHDYFHGEDSPIVQASPQWMSGSWPDSVGDGTTNLVRTKSGNLAVTTIPWPVTGADVSVEGRSLSYIDYVASLMDAGKQLQSEHPWLLLYHEPPIGTRLCNDYTAAEANFARQLIEKWQPDWSLHGHIHESMRHPDGRFAHQLGSTSCFNSGQSPDGDEPHRIELRISGRNWIARWTGADQQKSVEGTRGV